MKLPSTNPTLSIGGKTATFNGWFTAVEGGTQVTSSTIYNWSDTTFYAHWTLPSSGGVGGIVDLGDTYAYMVTDQKLWPAARSYCQSYGGDLVIVNTPEKNAKLVEKVSMLDSSISQAFIGLTDEVTEGVWMWVDGTPLSWSNWNTGEPNNFTGVDSAHGEDYAGILVGNGKWNDLTGTYAGHAMPFICEFSK